VTAADDPTLGGLLGPVPKRVEQETVLTISVRVGRDHDLLDEIASAAMDAADRHGTQAVVVSETRPAPLPSHVSVPGKTLADDVAEHAQDTP
jgi:hypothetical protein